MAILRNMTLTLAVLALAGPTVAQQTQPRTPTTPKPACIGPKCPKPEPQPKVPVFGPSPEGPGGNLLPGAPALLSLDALQASDAKSRSALDTAGRLKAGAVETRTRETVRQ